MGFYKNTGVTREITREIAATKLATQIYRSFHRKELEDHIHLRVSVILISNSSLELNIFRTRNEIENFCRYHRSMWTDLSILPDIFENRKSVERCNIILLKYYLLQDFDIKWWDNYGDEHGYNLNATLKSWDSTKRL